MQPPQPARRRAARRPFGRWAALLGLLALGGVGGAIAAVVVTQDDGSPPTAARPHTLVRTVTIEGSTVQTTVTTSAATSARTATTAPAALTSGAALNDAGYRKMQAGDYAGALPLLEQAVQKLTGVGFPTEAYANYNLGYTLLQLGRCDDAMDYLKTARKLESWRTEPRDAIQRAKECRKGGGAGGGETD
jgi:Tfp pilus assembly protein PilF